MSNPLINRWGINLFWYRFWFTDKNNSLVVNQDNLINKLILIYTHFGLLQSKNIFLNKYWYLSYKKKNILSSYTDNSYNLKYFRLIEYKNKILNEFKSYKIRNKIKNLYFSKIWILRYQKWLIINFYSFQPTPNRLKKKNIKLKKLNSYVNSMNKDYELILRYRFFLTYFLNFYLKNINYYKF